MGIKYKIDIIAALKEAGYNTSTLRKDKLLSEGVIQALRESKYISLQNVSKICELLDCQPGDLLEYVNEGQCPRKGRFNFLDKISPNTRNIYPVSAAVQVFTKPSVLLNRLRAAARPVRMEDCPMFPDTDLPLALIMEEILGWEKKEDSDKEKEDTASQQHLSTRNKKSAGDCYIFHRLLDLNSVDQKDQLTLLLCQSSSMCSVLTFLIVRLFPIPTA